MDPSIFLQYSAPNGLPQESKLVTYMNRSATTPTRSLNQALGKLSLESSPTAIKKVPVAEFIPVSYFTPANICPEAQEHSPPTLNDLTPNRTLHQVAVGEYIPVTLFPAPTLHAEPPGHLSPTMSEVAANRSLHQENVGGTTYFYATNADAINGGINQSGTEQQCLGVAVAASTPFASPMYPGKNPQHISPMVSKPGLSSFYMPETIRSEIYQRNEDVFLQTDLRQYPDLPQNVEMYSELTPLEDAVPHGMSTSFRATHRQSGEHFALRRLHSYAGFATKRLEIWKKIDHPNIVRLHEYFTTKSFNDHSMVLVYSYHPGSETLLSKYLVGGVGAAGPNETNGPSFHDPFSSDPDAPRPYTHQKNAMLRAVASGALLPEAVLWSLLVQLTAALRAIHTSGLACRTLNASKVVMNGCRARITWCGVSDSLHPNANDVAQAQQDDLSSLGRLALSLACRTIHCENLSASMDLVSRTYSADLKNLILYLLTNTARRSVTDLMPMIGARFYTQVEALERRVDVFEDQLAREVDNGRLLRILVKLGVVNERPELNMDASWSETGDRYLLKLFRDYIFHSVTADGRPWLDQAHLAHCLNQLDSGSNAKVELMSRDGQSVLVVTYAELKHCLEQAFEEVMQAGESTP